MKKIQHIIAQIEDEICGAEDYAKCAMKNSQDDRELSDVYTKLAEAELGHVSEPHKQVARMIDEYKEHGHDVPPSMKAVWDWEHERMVEHVAKIKAVLR